MQFNTMPTQVDFDKILDIKLMFYTDFVKPTCKVETLQIQAQKIQNEGEYESDQTPLTRMANVQTIPFVPKSRIIDMRIANVVIPGR